MLISNQSFITIVLFTVVLGAGCAHTPVASKKFVTKGRIQTQKIEGHSFRWAILEEKSGKSSWKQVKITPAILPYSGSMAKLSASARWLKIYEQLALRIKEECNGAPAELGTLSADRRDYGPVDSSPNYPGRASRNFRCG